MIPSRYVSVRFFVLGATHYRARRKGRRWHLSYLAEDGTRESGPWLVVQGTHGTLEDARKFAQKIEDGDAHERSRFR